MDVLSEEAYETDFEDFDSLEDPLDDDMEELGMIDDFEDDEYAMEDDMEEFDGEISDATLAQIAEMAESAAEAESDEEEDAFLGALAGLAASVAPKLLKHAVPWVAKAAKGLFGKHRSRKAVARVISSTIPKVASRIAQHVARGGRVTPRSVMNTVWRTSRGVLCNKHRRNAAMRRHKAMLRRSRAQRYARPYMMH